MKLLRAANGSRPTEGNITELGNAFVGVAPLLVLVLLLLLPPPLNSPSYCYSEYSTGGEKNNIRTLQLHHEDIDCGKRFTQDTDNHTAPSDYMSSSLETPAASPPSKR